MGFLNILLFSLVFAWVLWKLLDANPYFAAIRMGFERILEMLSLYSCVLSKFLPLFSTDNLNSCSQQIISTDYVNSRTQQIISAVVLNIISNADFNR